MRSNRLADTNRLPLYFSLMVLGAVIAYWITMLLTRSSNIFGYYQSTHYDTAMDFFHMVAAGGHEDPYYANSNYPAFALLIFRIFFHILPIPTGDAYPFLEQYLDGAFLRNYIYTQILYILFMLVCVLVIWELVRYFSRSIGTKSVLLCAAIVFSGPLAFLMERGNIMILVIASLMVYFACYDSPKIWIRLVGYIALIIAAEIKLYPAIFGLLILERKRYKEAIAVLIAGLLGFILPFFAFEGVASFRKFIGGVSYASSLQGALGFGMNYSLPNLIRIVAAFLGVYLEDSPSFVSIIAAICCIILYCLSYQKWQKVFSLVLLCIWMPVFSYTYTLALMILPIMVFFFGNEMKSHRMNLIYTGLFALIIIPYSLPTVETINSMIGINLVYPLSWGHVLINVALVILFSLIMVDALCVRFKCKGKIEGKND